MTLHMRTLSPRAGFGCICAHSEYAHTLKSDNSCKGEGAQTDEASLRDLVSLRLGLAAPGVDSGDAMQVHQSPCLRGAGFGC